MVDLAAGAPASQLNVVVDGAAKISTGYSATGNFHRLLGVSASIGRTLLPEDDQRRRRRSR